MCLSKSFRHLTPNIRRTWHCGLLLVTTWNQWYCVGVFSLYVWTVFAQALSQDCPSGSPELLQKWCATGRDLTVAALGTLSQSLSTCSVEARPAACSTAGFGFQTVTQIFLLLNDSVYANDSAFFLWKRSSLSFLFWFPVNDYM